MKIFAICMVKNEVDVIENVINSALKWADKVLIADHMSTDGTWELIDRKIRKFKNVEVFGRVNEEFQDGLRGVIYKKYNHLASEGDWWCRLDADEIYIDNPRDFIKKIPSYISVIRGAKFQYYFTDIDNESYTSDPERYLNGNAILNLKYYACNESETRFVKHKNKHWNIDNLWPDTEWPNLIFKKHIRLKHFQYRNPKQIQLRIDERLKVRRSKDLFGHEARSDWSSRINKTRKIDQNNSNLKYEQKWEDRIIDHNCLVHDDGENYNITENIMQKKIPSYTLQLLRSSIFVMLGRRKRISTR